MVVSVCLKVVIWVLVCVNQLVGCKKDLWCATSEFTCEHCCRLNLSVDPAVQPTSIFVQMCTKLLRTRTTCQCCHGLGPDKHMNRRTNRCYLTHYPPTQLLILGDRKCTNAWAFSYFIHDHISFKSNSGKNCRNIDSYMDLSIMRACRLTSNIFQ